MENNDENLEKLTEKYFELEDNNASEEQLH